MRDFYTDYRGLSLRNRHTRYMFVFNACLVLLYGKHDSIVCQDPEKALDLYPRVHRALTSRGSSRKHRNIVRRLMRAMDQLQPNLVNQIAKRAMIISGYTKKWGKQSIDWS